MKEVSIKLNKAIFNSMRNKIDKACKRNIRGRIIELIEAKVYRLADPTAGFQFRE